MKGLRGTVVPNGPSPPAMGTARPALVAVGAHGGPACAGSSQRPGLTSLRGQGVLPKRRSVLMEGLWGTAIFNGPGLPAWGDGESCPGGGWCSRRACGGQQLPTARAHHPEGTGSPAQAVGAHGGPVGDGSFQWPGGMGSPAQAAVGAHEGPPRDSSSQRPGFASLGGRGVVPRQQSVLLEGLKGTVVPKRPGVTSMGGRGVLPRWRSVLMKGL